MPSVAAKNPTQHKCGFLRSLAKEEKIRAASETEAGKGFQEHLFTSPPKNKWINVYK